MTVLAPILVEVSEIHISGPTETEMRLVNIRSGDPYDVLIARPSKWGNPFPIEGKVTREKAIAMYEVHIRRNPRLLADLPELVGKTLGCYCSPLPCHGEVLLRLLKERGLE